MRLVELGLAATRSKAQALIRGGFVTCNGKPVTKTGLAVLERNVIRVSDTYLLRYVSRGGLKLEKAITAFGLSFEGKYVLDIGSSTGGFTDCALRHGAAYVIAVDVGKNVMDPILASDPRVELHEETDIRQFPSERFAETDIITCDVSFISLLTVAEAIAAVPGAFELIALIKPQFECGLELARKYKGVVTDSALHKSILRRVAARMRELGFWLSDITYSPIRGGDGNIEYIARFTRAERQPLPLDALVDAAFEALIKEK